MSSHAGRLSPFLETSWGVGAIGTTSMLYLVNMFLVFFLLRHVGMPAAVAGSLLAVMRFDDAVIPSLCCLAGILLLLLYRLDAGRLAAMRTAHATGADPSGAPPPTAAPLPTAAR